MWICCASLLVLGARAQAQVMLPEIKPRVETAKRLAQELSALGGVQVRVTRQLEDKNIYFGEKGVALGVAVDSVAKCLHASVTKLDSGYLVSQSKTDIAQARATRHSLLVHWMAEKMSAVRKWRQRTVGNGRIDAGVQSSIVGYEKARKDFRAGKGDHSTGFFIDELLPPEELLEGLIERIGYDAFASVPSGTTAVYEDQPIPGALPLPKHDDLLNRYASRVEAAGRVSVPPIDNPFQHTSVVSPESLNYPDGAAVQADRLRLYCRPKQTA